MVKLPVYSQFYPHDEPTSRYITFTSKGDRSIEARPGV